MLENDLCNQLLQTLIESNRTILQVGKQCTYSIASGVRNRIAV